jgi:SAM-dependent methyltransferase
MPEFTVEFGRSAAPQDNDGRLDASAFHRNHAAIFPVLDELLRDRSGDVLEIGSGTGQHAVEFARQLPRITWWPTDFNDNHLKSIAAWCQHTGLPNLREPARLDASAADWRLGENGFPSEYLAMFCANVIHIAPWAVTEGLLAGAGRHLRTGGRLFLYGPFRRDGNHNAPSNEAFDQSLRRQNPEWGVRDTADLRALAATNGLRQLQIAEMPTNNAIIVFERA